jgi:hypothetical protein
MTLPTPEEVATQIVDLALPAETRNAETIAFSRG